MAGGERDVQALKLREGQEAIDTLCAALQDALELLHKAATNDGFIGESSAIVVASQVRVALDRVGYVLPKNLRMRPS